MSLARTPVSLLEYAWGRVRGRLSGMDDAEYLWQPVAGCWTVHHRGRGWEVDHRQFAPDPAPVSTLAWRSWHVGSELLAGYTVRCFGTDPLGLEHDAWFGTAAEALAAMDRAWAGFIAHCQAVSDEQMASPLGPTFGPYADSLWADILLHVADELIHHGAEMALLRDLYAHRPLRP